MTTSLLRHRRNGDSVSRERERRFLVLIFLRWSVKGTDRINHLNEFGILMNAYAMVLFRLPRLSPISMVGTGMRDNVPLSLNQNPQWIDL